MPTTIITATAQHISHGNTVATCREANASRSRNGTRHLSANQMGVPAGFNHREKDRQAWQVRHLHDVNVNMGKTGCFHWFLRYAPCANTALNGITVLWRVCFVCPNTPQQGIVA